MNNRSTKRSAEPLRAGQAKVLETAVQGTLTDTLEELVRLVEAQSASHVLGSILLMDEAGKQLRHGAGPSLHAEYNAAIDGIPVADGVGSCGTAAHTKKPVFVSDILTDPLWTDFRELATEHGLRACWSIPILSGEEEVLGTFAMYHLEPREPSQDELALVDFVIQTAALVIGKKRSEERLRESEEQLRLAIEAAEVGLWDLDPQSDQLFWPPRVKAMFGIGAEEPISMADFYAGLHPDDLAPTSLAFAAALDPKRRALYDVEYRTIGKRDGALRWVAAKGRAIFDSNGKCIRVLGTARDITSRKQNEQKLRELNATLEERVAERTAERNMLAMLVETTDVMIMAVDRNYFILATNAANAEEFERVYGTRPKAGDNMLALLADQPESQEQVRAGWARGLAGEQVTFVEDFGDPDRARSYYEIKFRPLRNDAGELVGAYQFVTDVSDRIRKEAQLAEAQEALRQAQKMEAMGQLTGGVAHDFNNLLTPIVGSLDMLQRKGLGGEREQRLIAGAAQSAERAKTLVQRLLAFARRQPLQSVPVDVATLVNGMADLVSSTTGPQIEVIVQTGDNLPPAKADPNQLEMALLNLAVNARDAMPGGGTLRISATAEAVGARNRAGVIPGAYIKLSVADTGVGMDEETLARAIEPFFSTKGVGKGTGLGLSMVHGLASQLGGAMTIQSRRGLGTNVELFLPQSIDLPSIADDPLPSSVAAAGKVLLVDDEELVRMSTADMLSDIGYDVVEAQSAEAALQLLNTGEQFDLVVTDHLMPGMSGTGLAAVIKTRWPKLPVLLVSGYAEEEGVDEGLARLIKPFRKDELVAGLDQAIG